PGTRSQWPRQGFPSESSRESPSVHDAALLASTNRERRGHGLDLSSVQAQARTARKSDRSAVDRSRSVEVVAEHLRPGRVPQLRHSLRLDLPDPFPGHAVHLANLVERAWLPV